MLQTPDTPAETDAPPLDDREEPCARCERLADAVDDLKERITELADENEGLQPDHDALEHLLDSLREYFEWADSDRMTSTLSPLLKAQITTTLREQVTRSIGEVSGTSICASRHW